MHNTKKISFCRGRQYGQTRLNMRKILKMKKRLKRIIKICKKNKDTKNEIYYKWILQDYNAQS